MKADREMTSRLAAYSDSVFAVIVTIMVLQLKPPAASRLAALSAQWPTFVSYAVSYVFIAIIWINHHYLSRFIQTSSLQLIWTNFIHLFLVSLLPFTTAWMAQTRFAAVPVTVYAALFVCTDAAYNLFERHILSRADDVPEHDRLVTRRRSLLALALFATAAATAIVEPWIGLAFVCTALALHLKPDIASVVRR